ncbi:MerR family transcriptional regulator [Paracoccus siganidrum]|uniref:MerR family transcriptional regulator n=1 Tax=Paracoccus siganidrum TaxID=1276757 RepID=A0A418ZV26_9RHOB|nr:MerR family transcriptional regulator [Paracoccus siganidrum]RJL03341.1 MerR family transcriptional regulator [Paracoccus siganidrum]RMC41094.1 MerR family transcriptional regulator [Paracoccus siganidrum]
MKKGAEAFRSIGEVARLIGVAPHVLRYWETQFPQLKPMKRPDGRRYYRPEDVRLAAGLCEVLREEGLTIRGAKKMLARDRGEGVRQRGAARLGEVMGAGLAVMDATATEAAAELATQAAEPAWAAAAELAPELRQAPQMAEAEAPPSPSEDEIADGAGNESDPADDPAEPPSHPPRARHRRRRHGAGTASLPLFPDLDGADAPAAPWLARLVAVSTGLRARHPQARHHRFHAAASRLRDAIAALG